MEAPKSVTAPSKKNGREAANRITNRNSTATDASPSHTPASTPRQKCVAVTEDENFLKRATRWTPDLSFGCGGNGRSPLSELRSEKNELAGPSILSGRRPIPRRMGPRQVPSPILGKITPISIALHRRPSADREIELIVSRATEMLFDQNHRLCHRDGDAAGEGLESNASGDDLSDIFLPDLSSSLFRTPPSSPPHESAARAGNIASTFLMSDDEEDEGNYHDDKENLFPEFPEWNTICAQIQGERKRPVLSFDGESTPKQLSYGEDTIYSSNTNHNHTDISRDSPLDGVLVVGFGNYQTDHGHDLEYSTTDAEHHAQDHWTDASFSVVSSTSTHSLESLLETGLLKEICISSSSSDANRADDEISRTDRGDTYPPPATIIDFFETSGISSLPSSVRAKSI